jgi:hypothetical protein
MSCYQHQANTGTHRFVDDHFDFPGLHGCSSFCGVEIYIAKKPNRAVPLVVVIATELPDNTGTSVTNAWPELADYIAQDFGFEILEENDPFWIEHYLTRGEEPEKFDRVHLERKDRQQPRRGTFIMARYRLARHRHPWEPTTREQVECLIGGEVYSY